MGGCLAWGVSGSRGVFLPGPGGNCLVWWVPAWLGAPAWLGDVPAWSRGGCTCLVPGGVWSGQALPPPTVNRMTHTCKNITLAKTSFRLVIIDTTFINSGGSKGVARDAPPGGPNSFNSMQFFGKFGKILYWRSFCRVGAPT